MKIPFLHYFRKEKANEATAEVAVVARPVTPFDKPASERFGKTVMPGVSRVIGADPLRDFAMAVPVGNPTPIPPSPRKLSLGKDGSVMVSPKPFGDREAGPLVERTIALPLMDLVPHLPTGFVQSSPIDSEQRVIFKASDLERGMATGHPTVSLRSIFQQAPDFFLKDVESEDHREVSLPFEKVLEQFASLQVRPDQIASEPVPHVDTPFLKLTIEDCERDGIPSKHLEKAAAWSQIAATIEPTPGVSAPGSLETATVPVVKSDAVTASNSAPAAQAPTEKASAPPSIPKRIRLPSPPTASEPLPTATAEVVSGSPAPIRAVGLPVPGEPNESNAKAPSSAPIGLAPAQSCPPLTSNDFSPNGVGVPATERVPASSGPPIPTPLPSPLAPPSAARTPFKVSPPSNDLSATGRVTNPAQPGPKLATTAFATAGPRIRLPLGNVLRGLSSYQLSGPVGEVPATATIEVPLSIIEPQLSLGRIAISPAQFLAALPEEFRTTLKVEETELPIPLPLQDVLQNLPDNILQLRRDQQSTEVVEAFETPFSKTAEEDAARFQVSADACRQSAAVPEKVVPANKNSEPAIQPVVKVASKGTSQKDSTTQAPPVAPQRTPLQILFDTDEPLDAKSIVTHASRLPGVSACAIVFSDGLCLAGNLPSEYEADALCALAPSIVKRIDDQMKGANLGTVESVTLFCAKTPVSFFAHRNICLAALHSAGEIAAEIRARLSNVVRELAQIYAQSA